MSNEGCGCDILNTNAATFAGFTEDIRVMQALNVLPRLFSEKRDFKGIVKIAALLPSEGGMAVIIQKEERKLVNLGFEDITERKEAHAKKIELSLQAIKGSFAHAIMDSPYEEEAQVIKFLADFAAGTEEKIDHWRNALLGNLLAGAKLESIDTWTGNSKGIKALIAAFNLPEEKILARLQNLIDKNKETDPCGCIKAAKKMGLPIDPQAYKKIADELMKQANKQEYEHYRKNNVGIACQLYKYLSAKYRIDTRDTIWKAWEAACSKSSCHTNPQSAIKIASTLLNFKYIRRGWERLSF